MRQKTRQLLFLCFSSQIDSQLANLRSYQSIYDLIPELTEGGVRSLTRQLVVKGYLSKVKIGQILAFKLTMAGRLWLVDYYPILSPLRHRQKSTKSQLLLLINSIQTDRGFVNLRKLLSSHEVRPLSRGVYYFERGLPDQLMKGLVRDYASSVLVVDCAGFSLGVLSDNEIDFRRNQIFLEKSVEIGNKLNQLLREINSAKELLSKNKLILSLQVDKLFEIIENSRKLSPRDERLSSQVIKVIELLNLVIDKVYFSQKN